ncbi:MAG: 2-oxo-4-hydroxy-4-carboxy-5-ureidoimidazoline decarboxylase [Nocardioidaceae bacterium]
MRSIEDFNAAPADEVTAALLACCAVPGWAAAIAEGRPYADAPALLARADQAARRLTPAEVDLALAAHPRIGERPAGADPGAAWSRQEQAAVDRDAETARALAEGNRAYEDRFGRVYLVCASGRSGAELLADLRRRLGNDDATEAAVVADELRKIALLRLGKVVTT